MTKMEETNLEQKKEYEKKMAEIMETVNAMKCAQDCLQEKLDDKLKPAKNGRAPLLRCLSGKKEAV